MRKFAVLIFTLVVQLVLVSCATSRQPYTTYTYGDPSYRTSQPVYVQSVPAPSTQEDPNKKIIKQALVGAATGAIAAEVSGGKPAQGALIGAGTNVIGGAVMDYLTSPTQPSPRYQPVMNRGSVYYQPQKRIIRQYDSDGNIVSEQEVWQ